ncbi:MAG: hypothetical protein WDO15_08480 [Bacteroidota bacterium]
MVQTRSNWMHWWGPLYGKLGDYYGNFADLNSTTDEMVVPTRGGD